MNISYQNDENKFSLYDDKISNIQKYIDSLQEKNKYKFLYDVSKYIDTFNFDNILLVVKQILLNNKVINVLENCKEDGKINIKDVLENYKTDTFNLILSMYCDLNDIELITDDYNFNDELLDNYITDSLRLYIKDIEKYPLLSKEEEKELFLKLKKGDEKAREKLINSNLRLVLSIAKQFINQGLSFLDLVQEGNIGLIKSISKFDVSLGFKFSTYATLSIRINILRAIHNKANTVRIPVYINEEFSKIKKFSQNFSILYGREPTVQEIANGLNYSITKVLDLLEIKASFNMVSLNTPISEVEDTELMDIIIDEESNFENDIIKKLFPFEFPSELLKIMDDINLSDRKKDILCLRWGILDNKPLSLEAIGKKYGITRERVRQIQDAALKDFKNYLYQNNFLKIKNKNDINELYLKEFEICSDLNKFDPSRIFPKFIGGTQMSTWFYDNIGVLLNLENKEFNLIQEQYKEYKDQKNKKELEKRQKSRDIFFLNLKEEQILKEEEKPSIKKMTKFNKVAKR